MTVTATEYLEIDGIPLATHAWRLLDLAPLYDGAEIRGGDLLVPHAQGVSPRRRRKTLTVKAFPLVVFGNVNENGVAYANPAAGLLENVEYLLDHVIHPTNTGDGTREAIWHRPDGLTAWADVHVLSPVDWVDVGQNSLRGVLRLSIPAGSFLVSGS